MRWSYAVLTQRQRNDLEGVQQVLRKGFGALHAPATSRSIISLPLPSAHTKFGRRLCHPEHSLLHPCAIGLMAKLGPVGGRLA